MLILPLMILMDSQVLLWKNHFLYTDNYYTAPLLTHYLEECDTESCSTVRPHRREYPQFPDTHRGECVTKQSGNMQAVRWHDKRLVHLFTTVHSGEMILTGKVERARVTPSSSLMSCSTIS